VSVRYRDGKPVAVETIVVSTQHADHIGQDQIRNDIIKPRGCQPVVPADLNDPDKVVYHINPTRSLRHGGPWATPVFTGRKIIVDTYGGSCPHGGGAFSGKDPTKVDRSRRLHGAPRGQEHRGGRPGRARAGAGGLRHRRARARVRHGEDEGTSQAHPSGSSRDPRSATFDFRPPRHHRVPQPATPASSARRPPSDTSVATTPTSRGRPPTA
jgi:hypothetical protein